MASMAAQSRRCRASLSARITESWMKKLVDQALLHAKDGYKNSQEVIKFVDTKTAVITGLNTLIVGSLVSLLKWSIESEKGSHATLPELAFVHPCIAGWFYTLVIG